MQPAWRNSLMMKAARREATPRPPIWLMRQAGRYLPEYRAIRRQLGFLDLCKSPKRAAEVMLATVDRLQVDAAILFSDLLVVLEPMGLRLEYTAGEGPLLGNPIREAAEVDRLAELSDLDPLTYVFDAVRLTRAGLDERLPLIGFAGAPFTLAAYAIEGGSSRDYRFTKTLMRSDPAAFAALLARLGRGIAKFLTAQLAAGAQLVQVFDSWAGCLHPDDYRRHVLPHMRTLVEGLPPEAPLILFATGNPALLPLMAEAVAGSRGRAIVGLDWRIRLDDAWRLLGHDLAIQGNLDPTALLGPRESVRRAAEAVLAQAAGRPGHIFNLGHGVLPQTPVENVLELIATVKDAASLPRTTADGPP